jgi:hypothetical protein
MRVTLLTASLALAFASATWGQPLPRFEFGPVVRLDTIFVEGDASGPTTAAGLFASGRVTGTFRVEAEVTAASDRLERSYDGWFLSYAGPDATGEEIERLAPTARRTLRYVPGVGAAAALVARARMGQRVALDFRAGFSARRYTETSTIALLTVPAGIDPARADADLQGLRSTRDRVRGGLLLGIGLPVSLARHLVVEPELRVVYGGPARIGSKHREMGIGLRGGVRF